MQFGKHSILLTSLLVAGLLPLAITRGAQQETPKLTIEDVMTAQEMKDTGISRQTESQRQTMDAWLNRYTGRVAQAVSKLTAKSSEAPRYTPTVNDCTPAIESTTEGDFSGWEGETIFKLDNGQIWQQAEYDYTYSYSYRPDVTIYRVSGGCRMKVEDEDETILVKRIR